MLNLTPSFCRSNVRKSLAPGLFLLFLAAKASAQAPDIRVRFDGLLSYRSEQGGPNSVRLYDSNGHFSTLSLSMFLETGFRVFVSERLERIANDPDNELLDEYYIEDPGIWRAGKQYLPFGSGQIMRESVPAARADTTLLYEGLPVAFAAYDGGSDRQRGVMTRIGSRIGVSIAIGEHFGIAGSSLTQIRHPEDSPGLSHGYERAFGVDAYKRFGNYVVRAEGVSLTGGATVQDPDITLGDFSASWEPRRSLSVLAGWTRLEPRDSDFYRLQASLPIAKKTFIEPMLRYQGGKFFDFCVNLRTRF